MEDKIFDIVTDLLRDDITKSEAIDKLLFLHSVVVNVTVCEHKNEDWKYDESGVDMYCTKCKDSEVELCDNPNCEDGIVDYDYYKNPIYCQVCDKHN